MSQSEGGEYPLPALFCKVTSHYVYVFVFWKDIVYFVSPRMTMLIKDTSNITGTDWASNIQIKTLFGFILSCLSDVLSLFTSSLYTYVLLCIIKMSSQVSNRSMANIMTYYDLFGKSCSPQMTGFYMLLCTVAGVLTLSAISFDRSLPSSSSAHLFSWLSWFLSGLWL